MKTLMWTHIRNFMGAHHETRALKTCPDTQGVLNMFRFFLYILIRIAFMVAYKQNILFNVTGGKIIMRNPRCCHLT